MCILKNIPKSINKLHSKIYPVFAKGSYVYTSSKKYLDLTSGIGALSTGHNHPDVINSVKEQLTKYVHIPQQVFKSHPMQVELTSKLLDTIPNKKMDNVFYVNSGSEATDNAIKIARKYTGKSNIISMNRGFHGRTIGALSVTSSNLSCKKGITPLMSNIFFCPDFTTESIEKILEYQSDPNDTAAIILESVQGEGGIYSIDTSFLQSLKKICTNNNILLIADEVQCGSMRTGDWWNIYQKNISPDLMTFGKGIASGYPLAGIASTSEIMNSLEKGSLGGTYGGNAICCAAASATIDVLNDEVIQQNVINTGNYIKKKLEYSVLIKNIRQYGLMIGIELYNPKYIMEIVSKLRQQGILVLVAGNKNQYIRLLPPLNVSKEEIDYFLERFKKILFSIQHNK